MRHWLWSLCKLSAIESIWLIIANRYYIYSFPIPNILVLIAKKLEINTCAYNWIFDKRATLACDCGSDAKTPVWFHLGWSLSMTYPLLYNLSYYISGLFQGLDSSPKNIDLTPNEGGDFTRQTLFSPILPGDETAYLHAQTVTAYGRSGPTCQNMMASASTP